MNTIETLKALDSQLARYGVRFNSFATVSNSKVSKNEKLGFYGIVFHLLPDTNIKVICPFNGLCSALCLTQAGNPAYLTGKTKARDARSRLFLENIELFLFAMVIAIGKHRIKAHKKGLKLSCRPNGTSDIPYEYAKYLLTIKAYMLPLLHSVGLSLTVGEQYSIFDIFYDCSFYDYTKIKARFGYINRPDNLHLTFSLDGANNAQDAIELLDRGYNVAVPFYEVPRHFWIDSRLFQVFDGDQSDYRPNDPHGYIIGLKYKRRAGGAKNNINNGFIIDSSTVDGSGIPVLNL